VYPSTALRMTVRESLGRPPLPVCAGKTWGQGGKSEREIQNSEFLVILLSGFVIGFCGVDFVVEVADVFVYAVVAYLDIPFPLGFVPGNTFVF